MPVSTGADVQDEWFRRVLGHYPSGVVIVTAMCDDGPAGMSVVSFTSVSLTPPLVAILPARTSTSWPRIAAADSFCINILTARQEALCRIFASSGADKFTGVSWRSAPSGAPILAGTLAWIDCALDQSIEAGDHYIVLGRVRALDIDGERVADPLIFFQGGYGTFNVCVG
jgi:3-hydroxy-9,10-secoandrosta-1,3,5(10)-triene-9,17-dione monooxygenase reductase component